MLWKTTLYRMCSNIREYIMILIVNNFVIRCYITVDNYYYYPLSLMSHGVKRIRHPIAI